MDSSQKFWVCVCGFRDGFENVQLHFVSEHGNIYNEKYSSCRLCNLIFCDTGILKQHSVIHIRQNYNTQVEQLLQTSPSNVLNRVSFQSIPQFPSNNFPINLQNPYQYNNVQTFKTTSGNHSSSNHIWLNNAQNKGNSLYYPIQAKSEVITFQSSCYKQIQPNLKGNYASNEDQSLLYNVAAPKHNVVMPTLLSSLLANSSNVQKSLTNSSGVQNSLANPSGVQNSMIRNTSFKQNSVSINCLANPSRVQNSFVTDSSQNQNSVILNPLTNSLGIQNSMLTHSSYQQKSMLQSSHVESATQTESSDSQFHWISEDSVSSNSLGVQASMLANFSCIQNDVQTKSSETQINMSNSSQKQNTMLNFSPNASLKQNSMLNFSANASHVQDSVLRNPSQKQNSMLNFSANASQVQDSVLRNSSPKQNSVLNLSANASQVQDSVLINSSQKQNAVLNFSANASQVQDSVLNSAQKQNTVLNLSANASQVQDSVLNSAQKQNAVLNLSANSLQEQNSVLNSSLAAPMKSPGNQINAYNSSTNSAQVRDSVLTDSSRKQNSSCVKIAAQTKPSGNHVGPLMLLAESLGVQDLMVRSSSYKQNSVNPNHGKNDKQTYGSYEQNSTLTPQQNLHDTQTKSSQNKKEPDDEEYKFNFRTLMLRKARNMSNEYHQIWKDIKNADALEKMLTVEKLMHLYKCMERDCIFTTDSENEFRLHFMIHNSCSKCVYCLMEFEIGDLLANHITEKHFKRLYQCSLCFYRASRKPYVKLHHQFYHGISSMEVLTCHCQSSKLIGSDDRNVPDIDCSTYAKPYKCALGSCRYMTYVPQDFRKHNQAYHGSVSLYPCSYCDYSGFSINNLIKHFQYHGLNNFQCTYCLYGSSTKVELLIHLIIQHADMPVYLYVRSSHEPIKDLHGGLSDTEDAIATVSNNESGPNFVNKSSRQPEVKPVELQTSKSVRPTVNKTASDKNASDIYKFGISSGEHTDKMQMTSLRNIKNCVQKLDGNDESCSIEPVKNNCTTSSQQNFISSVQQFRKVMSNVKKVSKKYKCVICSLSFKLFSEIRRHLRDVHCLRGFLKCAYCTKFGINKQFLRRHVISKHPKKNVKLISFINVKKKRTSLPKLYNCQYKCCFCPYGIQNRNKILEHMYEEELDYKKYQCAVCKKRFTHDKIVSHFSSAHPDCDFKFSIKKNLHIDYWLENFLLDCVESSEPKSNHKSSPNHNKFCCPFCNIETKYATRFLCHLYHHKENNLYKCDNCQIRFLTLSHYKLHKKTTCRTRNSFPQKRADVVKWAKGIVQSQIRLMKIKSEKTKSIQIQKSGKLFRDKKYLKLDIHYAAIYKCYYCGFSTNFQNSVERHCRIKHYKQPQRFLTSGKVIHKMKKRYSKLLKCWQCNKKIPSSKFRKHISEHGGKILFETSVMFHCSQCESEYSSIQMLNRHCHLTHRSSNKPFSFQVATRKEKQRFMNLYFYKCFYCNVKSITMKNLKDHVKEFHPSEVFAMKISSADKSNFAHCCSNCKTLFKNSFKLESHYQEKQGKVCLERKDVRSVSLCPRTTLSLSSFSEICDFQPKVALTQA